MSQGESGPEAVDRWKVALAEYESVRQESNQAREAQQAILSWSLAAFAVLFAGSLAAARFEASTWLRVVIFGIALPGLALGSCLTWAGELLRMERAGFYLRGRERAFWEHFSPESDRNDWRIIRDAVLSPAAFPLLWENFLWSERGEKRPGGKHVLAYAGAGLLFGGVFVTSLVMLNLEIWLHSFVSSAMFWVWRILSLVWTVIAAVVALSLVAAQAKRILDLGNRAAGLNIRPPDYSVPWLISRPAQLADRLLTRRRIHISDSTDDSADEQPEGL